MSINGFPVQILLRKSKEERTEVTSRLLSTFVTQITRTFELFYKFCELL